MTAPGSDWSRRGVLAGSAAALLACAACGANSGVPAATTPAQTTGSAGTAGGTSSAPLAKVSAIPAGSGLVAVGASGPVLLAESGGKVVAHTAVCTHQGATIDGTGVCPLHGSKFDLTTGAVLGGPATAPLAPVAVTVTKGEIYLG